MDMVSFQLPTRVELVLRLRMTAAQVAAYRALLSELHSGPQIMAKALKHLRFQAKRGWTWGLRTMMALRLLCNDPADLLQAATAISIEACWL